jgi:neutral ceramidase
MENGMKTQGMTPLRWAQFAIITLGTSALLVLAAGACRAGDVPIGAGPLRVGFATADITPEGPVAMAGFGFRKKPSEGVGKPITASCVVFDNSVTRVAMVAIDLCYIGKTQLDDLRAAAQKSKIPPQHLMVNFSHTHSGPNVGAASNAVYAALFKTRTDPLFAAAVANLQPALLDYTVGSSTMAINRRRLDDKGHYAGMLPEPRKAMDPDVPILRISAPDGKVRGVLFGYACHPSTLEDYRISPDYVGYARDWIAAIYPGCVPVFFQGCGGDIKARYVNGSGKFKFPENLLSPDAFTAELGHELGRAVIAALSVPPGPVPANRPKTMPQAINTPVQLGGIVEEYNAPDKKQPDKGSHRQLSGVWRVGDIYFVGAQCEIGSQIGLRIKRELAGARVWTSGYTHHGIGYFLDAASYPEGGYEIDSSSVAPAAENILVATVIRQVRTLMAGRTGVGPCPDPPKK